MLLLFPLYGGLLLSFEKNLDMDGWRKYSLSVLRGFLVGIVIFIVEWVFFRRYTPSYGFMSQWIGIVLKHYLFPVIGFFILQNILRSKLEGANKSQEILGWIIGILFLDAILIGIDLRNDFTYYDVIFHPVLKASLLCLGYFLYARGATNNYVVDSLILLAGVIITALIGALWFHHMFLAAIILFVLVFFIPHFLYVKS